MDNKQNQHIDIMAVNDKAFDIIAEIITQEEIETALSEMEAADAAGVSMEETEALRHLDAHFSKRIDKHMRQLKTKKLFTHTLPRIGQAAAVFITIITVAGTIAVASSSYVRAKVMALLYVRTDEYTQITMHVNEAASFDVPAEWVAAYYPSFVPEGLYISQIHSDILSSFLDWRDSEGTVRLRFFVEGEDALTNVDTEDAQIEYFEAGDVRDGMFITEGSNLSAVWRVSNNYFVLNAYDLDRETVIKIIEGIQRIK